MSLERSITETFISKWEMTRMASKTGLMLLIMIKLIQNVESFLTNCKLRMIKMNLRHSRAVISTFLITNISKST